MTIKTWAERLEHIPDGEITTSAHIQSAMLEEIEELRTQLAAIAESEPVAWAISYDGVTPYTLWHEGDGALLDCEVKRHGGTTRKIPLFTRPMPAQEPCPNGSKCKHGAWCTEVYCQELCEFRNQPAPQPAQDVPEVGFGNMPTKFLANGTRFKLSFDTRGRVSSLWNFMDELDGRWVALVAAEDDCHLQSAQPVAQYDKTEMNAFVTDLYQRKSTDGQHGFYETLFHVVHKAIARVGIREVK